MATPRATSTRDIVERCQALLAEWDFTAARKWKAAAPDREVKSHPDSIYAGAIGATIWGAFRHEKLAQLGQLAAAS